MQTSALLKRWRRWVAGWAVSAVLAAPALAQQPDTEACVNCHERVNPGIVAQWRSSEHAKAKVLCSQCHAAEKTDPDAYEHHGSTIATIVSPKDCGECHAKEFAEQKGSHHAKAGQILGSLDNLLGEVVGGPPAVDAGCRQCHGSVVRLGLDHKPTKDTWPNTGMGRINPDGSWGSCSACHARHEFSVRQARQPEACGKCHLGPDHPQIEVWNESKHGVMYHANRESMNLDANPWRAGQEYFSGPTCSSCHMSAGGRQPVTHDVGERLSWTLRPAISVKLNLVAFEGDAKEDILGDAPTLPKVGDLFHLGAAPDRKVTAVLTWQDRRARMQEVCSQCHDKSFVEGAYSQFDEVVVLFNDKFAKPAKAIIDELRATKRITPVDFDDPIEWTWYELWHHQGRRARHGAAMQGPDYTWWHGMYEVAKTFYQEFLPQVKEVAGEDGYKALLDKYVYTIPGHQWHRDGMSKDALQRIQDFYRQRYGQ
ncbi:MAG: cytochrome c3 family protein [Armatimonadetes bacterium]|nr:cytochrome c3 family protein [Armatimonadota bacterium]